MGLGMQVRDGLDWWSIYPATLLWKAGELSGRRNTRSALGPLMGTCFLTTTWLQPGNELLVMKGGLSPAQQLWICSRGKVITVAHSSQYDQLQTNGQR
jgi:hypothetical protein